MVVLFDELFGDVANFDVDILESVQRCLEVEIFNVESEKIGALRPSLTVAYLRMSSDSTFVKRLKSFP